MTSRAPTGRPLAIAVGLGTIEREQTLLAGLTEAGDVEVVARCLAAEELLTAAHEGGIDAVLVAADLHRLSPALLDELARTRLPLVVLTSAPNDPRWVELGAVTLRLEADATTVRRALTDAVRRGRAALDTPPSQSAIPQPGQGPDDHTTGAALPTTPGTELDEATVFAVGGGHGSPGRTTLALNLAVAFATSGPTALVDLDLAHPSLGALLDADVTRNLSALAHAEPAVPREWDQALAQETQPLDSAVPQGVLLCGVGKPELRGAISGRFVERLIGELRRRYRFVVLDVGVEVAGPEGLAHRTALRLADRVLFVAAADLLGLHAAHTGLGQWRTHAGFLEENLALVVNRHDRRYHYTLAEIEWGLNMPAAAVIPFDHHALEQAVRAQRPLLALSRGRAARAILDLAARLHGGKFEALAVHEARPGWLGRLRSTAIAPDHVAVAIRSRRA